MKTILITPCVALFLALSFSQSAAPLKQDETVTQKVQNFWIKSKGYLSDDWHTFKEGADLTLIDLGKQIDDVEAKAGTTAPGYFLLRIQSLKEQREFLTAKLGELNSATIKTRMSGPRYIFDKSVSSLEAAISQADDEAEVLAWIQHAKKSNES